MPFSRKYGQAFTIDGIPLVTRGAVDYKASPTLAAGDVTISKNGGAFTNITTLPTVTPAGGTSVQISCSADEATAARIVIRFIDQTSPKEWEDQELIVETYGHASAQHPGNPEYLDASVADRPTLSEMEASAVLAKEATVDAVGVAVAAIPTTPLLTNDARLDHLDADVSTRLATAGYSAPNNAGINTLQTDVAFFLSILRNKRVMKKESSTWYLVVYDATGNEDAGNIIMKKALKEKDGGEITDLAAGLLAQELKTSV